MSQDVYSKLSDFLDRMPGGFVKTESGIELKILKKLFTPEQAELMLHILPMPEPPAGIAKRAGMDEAKAAAMLEQMAKEGCIYRLKAGDQNLYMAVNFIVGIFEFHVGSMDREFAAMTNEYIPQYVKMWEKLKTKQLRVVPVSKSLTSNMSVAPYYQLKELVKKQERASVAPCICRKEKDLLGHSHCTRPKEMCFQFGIAADFYIDNGLGRKITIDEALALLDKAEELAMVPQPTGAQEITNICCCCGDCCAVLLNLKKMPRPADQVMSAYHAKIDPDECTACESCLERCQMDAIKENGDVMEVDLDKCIGCGLCVTDCPSEAISLVEKPHVEAPPANMILMMMQIAKERGLA